MKQKVIAIFDIGKTNKKLLLFNEQFEIVHEEEKKFAETEDDDGFPCDDIAKIENWLKDSIYGLSKSNEYELMAVNFSTYGASLVYLDKKGQRIGPLYNYLKDIPEDLPAQIYELHGGKDEFCRKTASPAMGMLNSGMQIFWLKRTKPHVYREVKNILHFPQYLSYLFTGKIISEYTSIGCHTAMWDFDNMQYHSWLARESIMLPAPVSNSVAYPVKINGQTIKFGTGIHDSSASLVPSLAAVAEPYILGSTGTWCIFMNPFNDEPLTHDELKNDTLCYLSTQQKQVKSSRFFLGHFHDICLEKLNSFFQIEADAYKKVCLNPKTLKENELFHGTRNFFFPSGFPEANYRIKDFDLNVFPSFEHAYHQLMNELGNFAFEALERVVPKKDNILKLFVSGGFSRNEILIHILSEKLPGKTVSSIEIKNATALGAAFVIRETAFHGKDLDSTVFNKFFI